ncbi:FAD-dependent monooxygenase [Rhizobium ruizarguesonis]|uniref:FAD-dependent monooxygenase n=1 Tax=Rhizobium ruizarguesonis TaxID=2081791 RepID=UPI00163AE9B8|nr:FAD-dependent monooxygenase [Rhizobium ruizarguesonis]MBC2807003.1 FAD-dependent monooxygenase [Rhizobium ruizarguesonis]
MLLLIGEMQSQMIASAGHKIYRATSGKGADRKQAPLSEIFSRKSPMEFMEFLADPGNGYLVPYEPSKSALIVDLLRPGREMGRHLDRRFIALHNQIGRMVVYEWTAAGCSIPGKAIPSTGAVRHTKLRPRRLLMQQYGMGAVPLIDVALVGTGPAGTSVATHLRKLGVSVCILTNRLSKKPPHGAAQTIGQSAIEGLLRCGVTKDDLADMGSVPRQIDVQWGDNVDDPTGVRLSTEKPSNQSVRS